MAKAILMSVRPKWVAKILNGEKTTEIRKRFPSDYVGWVYIYCTKGNKNECLIADLQPDKVYHPLTEKLHRGVYSIVEEKAIWNDCKKYILNGKVIARFWCDKVEEITPSTTNNFVKDSCLTIQELENYLWSNILFGYAIHITKLEIFDKPKEISEFYKLGAWKVYEEQLDSSYMKRTEQEIMKSLGQTLTRAPQSWCYIEYE